MLNNDSSIYEITDQYKLYVYNSLEQYRCDTFFTKEPETVEWIKTFFKKDDVFYDVGANIGVYSIYAGLTHPGVSVYGFEPYLLNFLRLSENIHLNHLSNVVPLYIALSDINAIEKYYIKDDRIGSSGNQVSACIDDKGNNFEPLNEHYIPVFSLDDFINNLSLPHPNHIKIDVDGIEDKIINGMAKTLAHQSLKSILIEINHNTDDKNNIKEIIQNHGFSTDNRFNSFESHSRKRRKGTESESAENVIFTRNN